MLVFLPQKSKHVPHFLDNKQRESVLSKQYSLGLYPLRLLPLC